MSSRVAAEGAERKEVEICNQRASKAEDNSSRPAVRVVDEVEGFPGGSRRPHATVRVSISISNVRSERDGLFVRIGFDYMSSRERCAAHAYDTVGVLVRLSKGRSERAISSWRRARSMMRRDFWKCAAYKCDAVRFSRSISEGRQGTEGLLVEDYPSRSR